MRNLLQKKHPSVKSLELSDLEMQMVAVINRLVRTNRRVTKTNIVYLLEIKIPSLINCWEKVIEQLAEKEVIKKDDNAQSIAYNFTKKGELYAEHSRQNSMLTLFFYNEFYQTGEKSKAHAEFCEIVYGKNLCQHGMMDMTQLNRLIEVINSQNHKTALELGCGNGYITEYLSAETGLTLTGVDLSNVAIELANKRTHNKRKRLNFLVQNLNNLSFADNSFDAIIAIDSLYGIYNLEITIFKMNSMLTSEGSMYLFLHFPPINDDTGLHAPEKSYLGQILNRLNFDYSYINFTEENLRHWQLKEKTLIKLKSKFVSEGSDFLFTNRMTECDGKLYNFHRYLFIIKKKY